ncbi:MAG: DMT family transporter [Rhodocyclales bacterium]|nr:DMT family transporter [Rhodocyclales bacterium]
MPPVVPIAMRTVRLHHPPIEHATSAGSVSDQAGQDVAHAGGDAGAEQASGFGMVGVIILVWPKIRFDEGGLGWPVLACLAATLSYGFAANYTKRNLVGVDSLVTATGSQACAALLVVPLAWWQWPTVNPSLEVWAAAAVLAIGCTGIAYILFFRLISSVGPARAIAVTFLIPAFGMLWGVLFLAETVTFNMLGGGAVILLGIGIANGLIRWPVGRGGGAGVRFSALSNSNRKSLVA